ncbi:unnamed protein product, partial [Pocillopora meandrina]
MEAENEDQTNCEIVSCDGNYTFNPVGWCADMAGANLAGFTEVFGETVNVRIKACEFPFKDHRNKNARKLDADIAADATEAAYYESSKAEIEEFYCNKGRAVDFVILGLMVARKTGFHFLRICTSRRAENESSRGTALIYRCSKFALRTLETLCFQTLSSKIVNRLLQQVALLMPIGKKKKHAREVNK